MGRFKLQRRTVLRGMIGGSAVALGLPLLEAMLDDTGTALAGGGDLPVRFVTFMFGNGVHLDRWVPATTGPGYALTEQLAPLAEVRDYCSVLSGFQHNLPGANGHANGVFGSFSGHAGDYYDTEDPLLSRPTGPSIDQVVADAIGDDTYLRSLQVANSKRTPPGFGGTMSFRGLNQPNFPYLNPQDVFRRLFEGPGEDDELRARILDAVLEDAGVLRTRLGASDRERLDAHLDGIADLGNQLTAVPPVCAAPTMPTETNADVAGQEPLEEVARAMSDLLVAAFRCDLTRVASFQQSGSVCQSIYWMTGATLDNHSITHEASAASQQLVHEAILINMQAFAYFLEALMNESEGAGTMLDNTVVLLGSDVAEGLSHSSYDMPVIVAGRAGGRLVSGRHIRREGQNLSDVMFTVAQAVAPEIESIGEGPGYSDTVIDALLG